MLDIGSGFGGPARWLAARHGASVDAVELQEDMNAEAEALTRRCGLSGKVTHTQGDILQTALEPAGYDACVSWLALYHIPNRQPLFPAVCAALRPGGGLYVEDLYQVSTPTPAEQSHLGGMMAAGTMQTRDAYVTELEAAGLKDVEFQDETADWAAFTADRLAEFRAGKDAYIARHSAETFAALEEFYEVIAGLLDRGAVGGVRLTAWKR